jgi:OTU domain-containing protein 6
MMVILQTDVLIILCLAQQIARLEAELDQRHETELATCSVENGNVTDICEETKNLTVTDEAPVVKAQKPSKAQRRREKKENDERTRQDEIKAGEKDNVNGPRQLEMMAIKKILASRNLCSFSIPSDGDCLYSAIKHQLKIIKKISYDISDLRAFAADYIKANKDSLIFYMTNPDTQEQLTDPEFDEYCEAVRNTKAWGGQIEIKAISNALEVPIEIIQATGPSTVLGVDEFDPPNLVVTFHRHIYRLGEHYDSTRPVVADDGEDGV